jgi:hypothetical protein
MAQAALLRDVAAQAEPGGIHAKARQRRQLQPGR